MNVLFIASLKAYTTAMGLIHGLRELGAKVLAVSDLPCEGFADVVAPPKFDAHALARREDFSPDLVLFCEGGTMTLFPLGLERFACPTAAYLIDSHMDYEKHKVWSRFFDLTFLAQKEYVERMTREGAADVRWSPLGYDSRFAPDPWPGERDLDIAYVGTMDANMNPRRLELLQALRRAFPRSYMGRAEVGEMYRIYAQARVVFNKSIRNDVNMRYFEATGNGALLLTDPALDNGREELFEEGLHYLDYDPEAGPEALVARAREALEIARQGDDIRREVAVRHSYSRRMAELLEICADAPKVKRAPSTLSLLPHVRIFGRRYLAKRFLSRLPGAL